jgi:ABC-type methionine transport system ATPase subunit
MAAKSARRTVRCKLTFPARIVGEPIMTNLANDFGVTYNMVRGRITDKGAWLTVDLQGAPRNVDRAMDFLRERGVAIEKDS